MRGRGFVMVCVLGAVVAAAGCARQRGRGAEHAPSPAAQPPPAAAAPAAPPAQPQPQSQPQPQYAAPQYAAPQYAAPQAPQYAPSGQPQYAPPTQAAPQYAPPPQAAPQPASASYAAPTVAAAPMPVAGGAAASAQQVVVNGVALGAYDLAAMAEILGQAPAPGSFWYDPGSGLWGLVGHGSGGVTRPGLHAAPLARDASSGGTGALINERELPPTELAAMIHLLGGDTNNPGQYTGRYSLDAQGNLFRANGGFMGNLVTAAANARAAGTAGACALTQLGTQGGILGQAVTVGCD